MKKKIAAALFVALATTTIICSCTKADEEATADYVCHCEVNSSSGLKKIDITLTGKTKADAVTTCATTQDTYNTGGNTATCTLQ